MKCPVCKDVTLLMSEKKGIEIDYCPECRGIWLDRGELEKLIEKENEVISHDYDMENIRRRKKNLFLGKSSICLEIRNIEIIFLFFLT